MVNNIILIKDFLDGKNENKLIINQVSDQIGVFYSCLIDYLCSKSKIVIARDQNLETTKTQSLFIENNVFINYSNNKKDIDRFMKMNDKIIIISDYRVFKEYSKKILSVNGYNYIKDIRYFIKNEFKINNLNVLEFCINNPHLAFSEISKYQINSHGYISDATINEETNFILNIRKQLFNLKRNNSDTRSIYENLKKEVQYKKFNFLIY